MAKSKAAEPDAEQTAAGGGKKKKILIIVVALVVLGGAWFMLMGPGSGKGEAEAAEPVPGEVVALEPITMNLADGRLLKVGLALQLPLESAGGGHGELNGSVALDEAISFLGEHTYAQLAVPEGRQKAKAELSKRVYERYHHEVLEVYFTEFVMQ
jgi:flagellar FliL protein